MAFRRTQLAALVLATTVACSGGDRAPAKPSIVLITVDTLRADHLGCYGYHRPTSPNLDRLAAEALVFERAYAHATETRTSLGSLLSGFLPHETQVAIGGLPLFDEVETLPEMLRPLGYTTAAVVSNYLLRRSGGWSQGFDTFDDAMDEVEQNRNFPERTATGTTDRAIEIVRAARKAPLFLWVHYQDPHGPYTPPERLARLFPPDVPPRLLPLNKKLTARDGIPSYQAVGDERDYHHYVSRYDGEIRHMDEELGRLLRALEEAKLYDDAWIFITADHGEEMGEHGYFFGHGETLYSSVARVPLIVRHGGALRGRRPDPVQHLDFVPTIRSLVGLPLGPQYRGQDLRSQGAPRTVVAELRSSLTDEPDRFQLSIVRDELKLVCAPNIQRYALYDLVRDPNEQSNRIADPALHDRADALIGELDQIAKQDFLKIPADRVPPPLSDEELEKLKSLGYVQ